MSGDDLVVVDDLVKDFPVRGDSMFRRANLRAVDHVSLRVGRGETLGLVGESGSGKSTLAMIVAGLLPRTSGTVTVDGVDFSTLRARELRRKRRHVQVVFQDPYAALAPTSTIEASITEPLRAHRVGDKASRRERVEELMLKVQLSPRLRSRFPSELSGGQLQRACIARSLALDPELLVLDEPVSALDVSTKAEVINLLADLKDDIGLSYLFITHDLSTLRVLADRVAVMYLGGLVEQGPAAEVYDNPKHPYTADLLRAVPVPNPAEQRRRTRAPLIGDVPSPLAMPPGCRFHPRCPHAMPRCAEQVPTALTVADGVEVSCHLYDAIAAVEISDDSPNLDDQPNATALSEGDRTAGTTRDLGQHPMSSTVRCEGELR